LGRRVRRAFTSSGPNRRIGREEGVWERKKALSPKGGRGDEKDHEEKRSTRLSLEND